jgi:inosine kinase
MKFPGRRKTKHYFPVTERARESFNEELSRRGNVYVVGIDQLLVDIEIPVTDEFLLEHKFSKGQSLVIDDNLAETIYSYFKERGQIRGEYPGGAVGNTLHNFSVLSECPSVALGAINKVIQVGDYAFKYICNTSSKVNLTYLQPSDKPMGRALTFVTPDAERTFAISKGCMNSFRDESVPTDVIEKASALLLSAYVFRDPSAPIYGATLRAAAIAKSAGVPVVLSLGSSGLVTDQKELLLPFIKEYANVLAMNRSEALALNGIDDPLLSAEALLEWVDMVLLTVGAKGLYLAGWCDREKLRPTKDPLHSKSIPEYNMWEYSRGMRRSRCEDPVKIYTHINPFMGGPLVIKNTNGAGDAALAAILHDMSANLYHRQMVPNSPKHDASYLTYSSLGQISKYANRVSFEVLSQNSPRLARGLPEREDSLEEAYWAK